jgi:pimeloyl-ACP methyl ester carboxylesterase
MRAGATSCSSTTTGPTPRSRESRSSRPVQEHDPGDRPLRRPDTAGEASSGDRIELTLAGSTLVAERWAENDPSVVLLHAGVADRRGFHGVVPLRAGRAHVVSYGRRGFGDSAVPPGPFSHLDDLFALFDEVGNGPARLVGCSLGGGLALDAALVAPGRAAGLVLFGPVVRDTPERGGLDPDTRRFTDAYAAAEQDGDLAEMNRISVWLWLDGPSQREGRVHGPAPSSRWR